MKCIIHKSKLLFFVLIAFAVVGLISLRVGAVEDPSLDPIIDAIPEDARDELPDDITNGEVNVDSFGFDYIIGIVKKAVVDAISSTIVSAPTLLGTLLISSAASLHFRDTLAGKSREIISLISCLSLGTYILSHEIIRGEEISTFGAAISTFVGSMTPALSAMQVASANTLGATVTASGFILFSSAVEFISAFIFIPLYKATLAVSVIASVTPSSGGASAVSGFLKRTFTILISAAAIIYVAVLSYQTHLAAAADSVAARGIKFAVSSSVPIVGGVLSDTVRTMASGLSLIKSGAGALGIVVLIILSLPILAKLFVSGMIYGIAAFAAGLLGCEREAKLFSAVRSALGLAGAVVSVISVVFIIGTALFIKTAPAISP